MSTLAAIALGSNLDSPGPPSARPHDGREANLLEAVERIVTLGTIIAISGWYDTAPVGYLDQPRFLNGALLLQTELPPEKLMRRLLGIELAMGRDRSTVAPKGPRVIDLDLLLFGDAVVSTDDLTLPHPAMHERRFVLEPLAEIAPDMVHPVLKLTVQQMLDRTAS